MTKKKTQNFKIFNAIICLLFITMLGLLLYCGFNMKTTSDMEFLGLQDHLLNSYIKLRYQEDHRVCEVESHFISDDGDFAVRFWCQDYSNDAHEPNSDKQYHTLYFQKPRVIEGGTTGYAEALGD